jgi:hypothetical protein
MRVVIGEPVVTVGQDKMVQASAELSLVADDGETVLLTSQVVANVNNEAHTGDAVAYFARMIVPEAETLVERYRIQGLARANAPRLVAAVQDMLDTEGKERGW